MRTVTNPTILSDRKRTGKQYAACLAGRSQLSRELHYKVAILLSSLRDAATLEWMAGLNNSITIFKEHRAGFEKEVLQSLEKFYEVKR